MYKQGDLSPLGRVDLSEPKPVWNTLSICATGLTNVKTTRKKLFSVLGKGSGLSFTVQIAEGASEIALDQPHTVNVRGDKVSVFQFNPPQGISDKQLDITATSQSKVAAYLKLSQNCKEVDLQEDLESINYKKASLRLSFATKGRITLSSVSIPPLTDSVSRWFIGIGLKNLSGDVKLSESKNVTLKLTRSFDYSYAAPISVLFFVSLVVGISVSIVANFLFGESLTQVKPGEGNQANDNANLKVSVWEIWEVIRYHWFFSGRETYSYINVIVGVVLIVGASQFVFANWETMIQKGDRDNCYYNDFCYRVVSHDIPFNLIISNLTYIVHGLILLVWVVMLEAKVNLRRQSDRDAVKATAIKKRYSFSIGYAFSSALVFQGLTSALYHLCPSRATFQLDLAFMFIMAGLTVLLYDGIEQNPYQNEKHPFGASNYFLFFIVPLFIFNYFGALINSNSGLKKVTQGYFFAFLVIWWLVMVYWTFRKLYFRQEIYCDDHEDYFKAFLVNLVVQLAPCVICMFYFVSDLTQAFLYVCITCSVVAILGKAWVWELSKCKSVELNGKGTLQFLFILLTDIIWVAAVGILKCLSTTNKTSSPEKSRGRNEECVILGFFDWHDLWHFLSSFAFLMSAFVVMFISSEPEQSPQAETRENNEPDAQRKKRAAPVNTRGNNEPEAQRRKRAVQTKTRGNNEPGNFWRV